MRNMKSLNERKSIILLNSILNNRHSLSRSLLRAPLPLLLQHLLLALPINQLILALNNLLRLLTNELLLCQLHQTPKINLAALIAWTWTLVVEAVEDAGFGCDGRFPKSDLDGGLWLLGVFGEQIEEGSGEGGVGVVVDVDESVGLVGETGVVVVAEGLWGFVGVGLVVGGTVCSC